MKCLGEKTFWDMASCLVFVIIFGKRFILTFWPWLKGQGLYLGTKYEVCRWNRIQHMANCLLFNSFLRNLTLTFEIIGTSVLGSLDAPYYIYLGTGTKYEVCRWNIIRDMVSHIFIQFWGEIWPWPVSLPRGQAYHHLGCWLRVTGLYSNNKYKVFGWNCIRDIAHFLDFGQIFRHLTLTCDLDL